MTRSLCLLVLVSGLSVQAAPSSQDVEIDGMGYVAHHSEDNLKDREKELNSLLQAGQRTISNVHMFLGKQPGASPYIVPQAQDIISPDYWKAAQGILGVAGMSTPLPSGASINAPPLPPTPKPWHQVMQDASQPLDTKIGGAIMDKVTGPVTPTPPPSQAVTDVQFIAQCPMILFSNDLSIRAPSCGLERGQWVDPSIWNPRTVLRWQGMPASGVRFGVDSALSGNGAALFAEFEQALTLNSYKFILRNCLGVGRYHVEEMVYKVDSIGKVTSTMELHDVNFNSVAYFFKYVIKKPTGVVVAESTLYRETSRQLNFTEVNIDGINTGKVLAMVTREGDWKTKGWRECMSANSPRGWLIQFPLEPPSAGMSLQMNVPAVATVQDLRVAMAATVTLLGHRDENRSNGLNLSGSEQQMAMFAGAVMLTVLACLLLVNCSMVFKSAGLKDKMKRVLFDVEQAALPKGAMTTRTPVFHPAY